MKKLFALFTACFLILAVPLPVYAQQPEIISTEIIPQADGGVLEITLTQDPVSTRAAQTKSGTKTVSKKNASGQVDVERIFERNVYLRREESHLYIKQHNRQYSCYFLEAFQQKCRQDR